MGRVISSRLVIEGTLEALTPLHVGGYGDSSDTDLPLAQNGRGEWYVPGTSLAGVFRSWGRRLFGEGIIAELFGPTMIKGDLEAGHASFVIVEDATITNLSETIVEIRDGVGIDRRYGTAANRVKYDRTILPRGTRLKLRMIVELKNGKKRAHSLFLKYLLKELLEGKLQFGAAITRGLGRMKLLESVHIREDDYSTRSGFLRMLQGKGKERTNEAFSARCGQIPVEPGENEVTIGSGKLVRIYIYWKPRRSLMVKAGFDGNGVDMLPLTSGINGGNLSLALPGSSIKGVLRSHAERILRTLLEKEAPESFLEQVESVGLVNQVFGRRNRSEDENGPGWMIGALSIRDCYSTRTINRLDWEKVISANANPDLSSSAQAIHQSLAAITPNLPPAFSVSHHVAIDRWTGGAAEGALFSVLEPINDSFEPIEMSLDLSRLEGEDSGAERTSLAVVLLLFLLRDMTRRRIPFGFGSNRGLGEIEINGIGFDCPDSIPRVVRDALNGVSMESGAEADPAFLKFEPEKIRPLGEVWKTWVERNRLPRAGEEKG